MRILVVSQHYWPETFRITDVVQSLRDVGCEMTVLTGQPNYPNGVTFQGHSAYAISTEIRDGVTICRVPLVPRGRGSGIRLFMNYLSFIVSASLFGPWLIRGRRFDTILVYATSPIFQAVPGIWLARLKGARLVTWVQDLWPESLRATGFIRNSMVLRIVELGVRWIYRRNDLLLGQSRSFLEAMRPLAGCTPIAYHPNPGELVFSQPTSGKPSPLMLRPGFNILFTGNLGTAQALPTVLAAAELLRDVSDVRFVLVGSGRLEEWLKGEVSKRGLNNIDLVGRFAPEHIPSIVSQASALLLSLVRDPIMALTVPSKTQAYLAAGRPIIACLDGEAAQVVLEAQAGIACSAEDASALAGAVRNLRALPPKERERMGIRGKAYYANNYEPTSQARRLMQLLGEGLQAPLVETKRKK